MVRPAGPLPNRLPPLPGVFVDELSACERAALCCQMRCLFAEGMGCSAWWEFLELVSYCAAPGVDRAVHGPCWRLEVRHGPGCGGATA